MPPKKAFRLSVKKGARKNVAQKKKEYEVETILDEKRRDGRTYFLVVWKGYGAEHNSWEPIFNLDKCCGLIEAFRQRRAEQKVRRWLASCQDAEVELEFETYNDLGGVEAVDNEEEDMVIVMQAVIGLSLVLIVFLCRYLLTVEYGYGTN